MLRHFHCGTRLVPLSAVANLMQLLNDSRLWRGVAFLYILQKGAEEAQGTHGKNEYEPQRVVDVKVVSPTCGSSSCHVDPPLLHLYNLIAPTIAKQSTSHRERLPTEQS